MEPEIVSELIKIIPDFLWFVIFIVLIFLFYKPIRNNLIPRMSQLKGPGGFEFNFIKDELERATNELDTETPLSSDQVARRAKRLAEIIEGSRILIVNDIPSKMRNVINILETLKVKVDVVASTSEALSLMVRTPYDVIISDIKRGQVDDEGIRFLEETVHRNLNRPSIFLVRHLDSKRGTPLQAFGITNRVDELFNLVFDVLERVRG